MKIPANGSVANSVEGEKKLINSQLWHACAGPLVSLPPAGSLVVYFPQGHSEQVAASMHKKIDDIPSYPNLPSKLVCMLHNVTLHADTETDEVYAQMTLQPVNKYDQEALLVSDIGLKSNRQPTEFFCKTLTASDTSTHGGFSVPRRAAEKIFPPLDFSMQPPAQELSVKDLHDQTWTFRHIYRGQPKRHLLTTGWSVFVSSKRLIAGDAVLFIRDEKSQLLLGIRRANRQQSPLSSSVISSDSMHIGILAAAAHAAANSSPFTIFYNPRTSPTEFVVPLAKYNKAMYTQVSLGMRFRMMFETEESGVRRYVGTVTGTSDLDPLRWKGSQWRNLQVGWDESTAGERPSRVSIWEIEPVVTPFYICPPPFFRPKFPKLPGYPDDDTDIENIFKSGMPWVAEDFGIKDASSSMFPGLSLDQWMSMQQTYHMSPNQAAMYASMLSQDSHGIDNHSKLLNFQSPTLATQNNLPSSKPNVPNQQVNPLQQSTISWPQQAHLQQMLNSQSSPQQQMLNSQTNAQQQYRQQFPPQQQQRVLQQPNVHQHQPSVTSVNSDQIGKQYLPQTGPYSQLQQQQLLAGNTQVLPNEPPPENKTSFPMASMTQDLLAQQQQAEQQQTSLFQRSQQQNIQLQLLQQSLAQRTQVQPGLSEQQFQLQLLQRLQQQQQKQQQQQHHHHHHHQQQQRQQQHLSSQLNPLLESQKHQVPQRQQSPLLSPSTQRSSATSFPSATHMQSPQFPINQFQVQQKTQVTSRSHSLHTDAEAPSCSTSPKNSIQISQQSFMKNSVGQATFQDNSVHQNTNLVQENHGNFDARLKNDFHSSKAEQPKYKGVVTDQLDASSSATSYCLDAGGLQQTFPLTSLDNDVQSHSRGNLPFATIVDGLAPDALLSRDYDAGKDIQNLLSNYSGTHRDIDTDMSSGINSQSFGVQAMSFKAGGSNDAAINDTGVPNGGLWPNQTQRMRTYTKVQKRGSVGRTIDVTRYIGYDELMNDLARMFGIEGLLEDPQRNEWKLVYVDHENDILLVGDDPWEEFVSCVQSIKILSSAEVQQMSLDGDFGQLPVTNQACRGTDSGNAWRGQYDDNSATSFNR